jgi:hypothetical protein
MANQSYGRGTGSSSVSEPSSIAGVLGLAVVVLSIVALFRVAHVMLATLSVAGNALFGNTPLPLAVGQTIAESAIAGVFAGIGVVILQSFLRKSGHLGESLIAALFDGGLASPKIDGVFWFHVALGGTIGMVAGWWGGAGGYVSVFQLLDGSAASVLHNGVFPLAILAGGGFGGPEGGGFFAILFIMIVIIISTILVAILAGLIVHILLRGLAGMAGETTRGWVIRSLSKENSGDPSEGQHPYRWGVLRGLWIGLATGTIEALCSAICIVQLFTIADYSRFFSY